MGIRGARLTDEATRTADDVVARLSALGSVTAKAQFGGYGLYESGTMLAMVDSDGDVLLCATEETARQVRGRRGRRHGRRPYWSAPDSVAASDVCLREWAGAALELARKMRP